MGSRGVAGRLAALACAAVLGAVAQPALGFETAVERVQAGVIMDVSPTKILYRDLDGSTSISLHIKDRATGVVEDIPPGRYPTIAFLSPHGAIFSRGVNLPNVRVHEWRDGELLDLGQPLDYNVLRAAGNYAVWSAPGGAVYRRDLAAGTTLQVGTNAASDRVEPAPNGDVYWHSSSNPDIFRWRDGGVEQLTDDAYWNYDARADGVNVAYTKAVPSSVGMGDKTAALMTPSGEEILLDAFRDDDAPRPRYDVAGGWTVFSRVGPAGEAQVWRRSPDGGISQVGVSRPSSMFFDGLGPNGDVWIASPFTSLAKVGSTALPDLGDGHLFSTWTRGLGIPFSFLEGDRWLNARGDTIYEITTGYPRPKGATPTRLSLVQAYKPCAAANRVHGPPLAFDSCHPPQRESEHVTVGTADANARPVKSEGSITFSAVPGNPATPTDEADLALQVTINDVRRSDNLEDYTGELRLDGLLRITDRNTRTVYETTAHGTTGEMGFPFTVPCTPTADTTVGSTCSLTTTLDAGAPIIKEGARSMWQLQEVKLYDGGADGDVDSGPYSVFAVPGVFAP